MDVLLAVGATTAGPLGVWLGWWLSERSADKREASARRERTEDARNVRVVALLQAARDVESLGRSLAHAAVLRTGSRAPETTQVQKFVDGFNAAMGDLDRLLIEARVFGPDWLVPVGEELIGHGRTLTETGQSLQQQVTANALRELQDDTLPNFIDAIDRGTATARTRLGE